MNVFASLIRDRIVLGIKNEQTTKKLLRTRDLTLNKYIDICRSEEVTDKRIKSLAEPEDINQVKSKGEKQRPFEAKKRVTSWQERFM